MQEEPELIYSQLQQTYTVGDKSIDIQIYRLPQTGWTIEVVDEHGNSTVWNDEFATNTALPSDPASFGPLIGSPGYGTCKMVKSRLYE
jgi:hypothetical protein